MLMGIRSASVNISHKNLEVYINTKTETLLC
jgi:hypothetical protein